jgi:hypothetical protein
MNNLIIQLLKYNIYDDIMDPYELLYNKLIRITVSILPYDSQLISSYITIKNNDLIYNTEYFNILTNKKYEIKYLENNYLLHTDIQYYCR